MVSEKLNEAFSKARDWLNEQEWYREAKGKWDELDSTSKQYVRVGMYSGSVLVVILIFFSMLWSVHSLKSEYAEKQDLLAWIQTANEEIRRLRDASNGMTAGAATGPWNSYFESVGQTAGIEKSSLTISPEKPGSSSEIAKESLFEVSVKHVGIKQVIRMAFGLESGGRPVKLRNLSIDTKADPAGYMDATLSISAYAMVTK